MHNLGTLLFASKSSDLHSVVLQQRYIDIYHNPDCATAGNLCTSVPRSDVRRLLRRHASAVRTNAARQEVERRPPGVAWLGAVAAAAATAAAVVAAAAAAGAALVLV